MRFLFFITIFFAFVSNANSQLPKKLKYDELIYSFDSTTVLIRKGSISSVYDLEKSQYAIAPAKNKIINFPNTNNYAEINSKTGHLSIYQILTEATTMVRGDSCSAYIGFGNPLDNLYQIDLNGKLYNLSSNEFSEEKIIRPFNWAQCAIEKVEEGIYIINSYQEVDFYRNQIDEWMMIDGFNRSGVFDFNQKKWIIEPIYRECKVINGNVICSKPQMIKPYEVMDDYPRNPEFNYLFDIFQLEGKVVEKIYEDVAEFNDDLVAKILDVDKVRKCDDNIHWVTIRDEKEGFVRFQLFDQSSQEPYFCYTQILYTNYDMIIFNDKLSVLITINNGENREIALYSFWLAENNDPVYFDEIEFLDKDTCMIGFGQNSTEETDGYFINSTDYFLLTGFEKHHEPIVEKSNREIESVIDAMAGFQAEFVNDTLIIVQNFSIDIISWDPMMSILYPGEDSIDQDGNFVYYYEEIGIEKSGVYNLKSDTWQIPATAKSISKTGAGFLVEYSDRSNVDGLFENSLYSFIDFDGNEIFNRIDAETLFSNLELLKYCVPNFVTDSLFEAPYGSQHHTLLKQRNIMYYAASNSGLGLFEAFNNSGFFYLIFNEAPQEFVHVNKDENFRFWLEGDSVFVEVDSVKKAVSRNYGKIILTKKVHESDINYWGQDIVLRLINGTDTVIFTIANESDTRTSLIQASIEVNGDILIVNDLSLGDNSCVECIDDQGIWYGAYGEFETENTSVWKRINGQWVKVSPYYAEIIPIPGGYIARTGFFKEEYSYYESRESELEKLSRDVPSRYFLLDSNLNVVPYMDWFDFPLIEDLGFGLKVCYDNSGCFFMTYNRVAVTNAEWDDFELFGKKLKAIKNEVPMIDEYGEQVYDENGVQVMASESVIMFFKIP